MDKYFASPLHMDKVREYVKDIYSNLARSNFMEEILTEITGEPTTFKKNVTNLPDLILDSEYIIS